MLFSFDPLDPFPLLSNLEGSYEASKQHSYQVDRFLGYRIPEIEHEIAGKKVPWAGLAPSILLTPYSEIRWMLERLGPAPGSLLVELGSGYSRMAHVLHRHWPQVRYLGLERVTQRLFEAERLIRLRGLSQAAVLGQDATDSSSLPEADLYFLYDLSPDPAVTKKTLLKLACVARQRPIRVVGRGRATRTLIEREEPWLSGIHAPQHLGNFSIYRS
jgi:hypothetical protein